jgi:hypothetical protein
MKNNKLTGTFELRPGRIDTSPGKYPIHQGLMPGAADGQTPQCRFSPPLIRGHGSKDALL